MGFYQKVSIPDLYPHTLCRKCWPPPPPAPPPPPPPTPRKIIKNIKQRNKKKRGEGGGSGGRIQQFAKSWGPGKDLGLNGYHSLTVTRRGSGECHDLGVVSSRDQVLFFWGGGGEGGEQSTSN